MLKSFSFCQKDRVILNSSSIGKYFLQETVHKAAVRIIINIQSICQFIKKTINNIVLDTEAMAECDDQQKSQYVILT